MSRSRFLPCLLLAALPVFANSYSFQTIDVAGASTTSLKGVNDLGQIIGYSTSNGVSQGFVYSAGSFQTLTNAGSTVIPFSINNAGQFVANNSVTPSYPNPTQYLYSGGKYSLIPLTPYTWSLPFPPISDSAVVAINNSGQLLEQVSGFAVSPYGGYAIVNGNTATLSDLGAHTFVTGFNSQGGILSEYESFSGTYAYVNGIQIGSSFPIVNPASINDQGEVVGYYASYSQNGAGPSNGFLYQNGVFSTLDFSGAVSTELTGIDDNGDIVGDYQDANGATHGFLATLNGGTTPVPEPTAVWLVSVALLALLLTKPVRAGVDVT